jgi:cysteine desulfurase
MIWRTGSREVTEVAAPGAAAELPAANAGGDSTKKPQARVYLDHAAGTPMHPEAVAEMTRQLSRFGNPSSLHSSGRTTRRSVEECRESIAASLNARPGEVVFTSGGTESNNLAVKGIYWSRRREDARRRRVLSTAVEHRAVLGAMGWLEDHAGAQVELLPVNRQGELEPDALRASIDRDPASVAVVSVMWANNEVGTLQPIRQVVSIAHAHGIPVHTDAVQAVGQVPVDFAASGVDALTFTAHKLGGPSGVGALVVHRPLGITPLLHGGGQEGGIRPGTTGTAAIAGFAAAVRIAVAQQPDTAARISQLRDDLAERVCRSLPGVGLNGYASSAGRRLPGNANLHFPGCEGDSLVMLLDARGIEASTGSACSVGVPQPSHVLLAMGLGEDQARSSLRLSLGHTSTQADVDAFVEAIGPVVERARARTGATLAAGRRRATGGRSGKSALISHFYP